MLGKECVIDFLQNAVRWQFGLKRLRKNLIEDGGLSYGTCIYHGYINDLVGYSQKGILICDVVAAKIYFKLESSAALFSCVVTGLLCDHSRGNGFRAVCVDFEGINGLTVIFNRFGGITASAAELSPQPARESTKTMASTRSNDVVFFMFSLLK